MDPVSDNRWVERESREPGGTGSAIICSSAAIGWSAAEFQDEGFDILHKIAPLADPRWNLFVDRHPDSSVFHSSAWLRALQETYDFQPVAFTSSSPDADLSDAVLFCRVSSWLTGHRLVSLPYSDHCEPLAGCELMAELCEELEREVREHRLRYFELRPIRHMEQRDALSYAVSAYFLHLLDLTPDLDALYRGFHKSSIQRKIRRASREGLVYDEGRSEELLDAFCCLLSITRRRHGVPSQPRSWFENLIRFFGDALKISVASAGGKPVASILTIRHKRTLVYKYGCSDIQQNRLGGMQFLLWKAIQDAKQDELKILDLGRSDASQAGLLQFKERWGCEGKALSYLRYTGSPSTTAGNPRAAERWKMRIAQQIVSRVPDRLLTPVNRFLYKHGA